MTVAAIHVPTPLIESPSVRSVVRISDTSVAMRATPPRADPGAPECADQERLHQREDDGEDDDGHDEAGRIQAHSVEDCSRDEEADRIRDEGDHQSDEEPDHVGDLITASQGRLHRVRACRSGGYS